MKAKELTTRTVATLKPGRREVPDGRVSGLYVQVGTRGPRSWVLRYRRPADGRPAKLTLGSVYLGDEAPEPALGGPLTLAGARKVALEQRSMVDLGRDPGAEKRDARAARRVALADTFGDLLREYHDRHAFKKNRAAGTNRDILLKECADWLGRPARMVTRRDMRDLLDGIVDRGSPVMANRVRSYLSAVFAWGIEREMVDGNPAREVARPAHEEARDRVLDDGELAEVWRAAETLGDPWAPLAKILILTGQRLGEVEAMRWTDLRDLDGDEPVWHIPAEVTKNKLPHDVPLPPEVAAILRDLRDARRSMVDEIAEPARRRLVESVPFVFWGGRVGRGGAVTKLSGRSRFRERWRAAVDAARGKDGMPDWRPHDLRRTAVSGMARIGVPIHVAEIVVNHRPAQSLKGVARVYNRYDYAPEQRRALAAWAARVAGLVEGVERPGQRVRDRQT